MAQPKWQRAGGLLEDVQLPLIENDAVVLGILLGILALIFRTSSSEDPRFKKFYTYIPALLLCYFLPGLLGTLGVISGEQSKLYFVASRYLLPTSLVLLTLSLDLRAITGLGPRSSSCSLPGRLASWSVGRCRF